MANLYTTRQFDVLDELCHRWYGGTQGTVEAVLAANPDLAELLPILPAGVVILMPELARPHETVSLLRRWGSNR
ncbi:MAG: tail protein X [Cyanobacteria bacterium J06638_7]